MQTLNVLNKGQAVIPAELRQRLGIKPGHVVGDHLELYPLPTDPLAAFRGSLKKDVSLADELIEERKLELRLDADQ